MTLDILVVDDEASGREAVSMLVDGLGHDVEAVGTAEDAVTANHEHIFDVALVDLRLGGDSGLELVSRLQEHSPWLKVAVITAHGSIESAVEAIRRGASSTWRSP